MSLATAAAGCLSICFAVFFQVAENEAFHALPNVNVVGYFALTPVELQSFFLHDFSTDSGRYFDNDRRGRWSVFGARGDITEFFFFWVVTEDLLVVGRQCLDDVFRNEFLAYALNTQPGI